MFLVDEFLHHGKVSLLNWEVAKIYKYDYSDVWTGNAVSPPALGFLGQSLVHSSNESVGRCRYRQHLEYHK